MARLLQSGAELQSVTNGVEADSIVTGVAISTTASKVRSGLASWKFAPSGTSLSISYTFSSAGTNGAIYSRVYVLFDTLPVQGGNRFSFLQLAGTGGGVRIQATVTNTGILALTTAGGVVVGQTSAGAIVTGHWYRVELNGNAGAPSAELRYVDCGTSGVDPGGNGISVAVSSSSLGGSVAKLVVALPTATTTQGVMYADDIAVNDATGSAQNTWCGAGKIIHLHADAAGDSNTFPVQVGGTAGGGNNWTRVDEIPPDDATSYNASAVLNASDLFAVGASGVGTLDTINTVCVGARMADLVGADVTAAVKVQIEKTSGGTKAMSAALAPDTVTWTSNPTDAGASVYPLVTYLDPDGAAWAAGTLASMQIGYLLSTTNVQAIGVTNVWASVDYNPLVQIVIALAGAGAMTATVTPYQRLSAALAGAGALTTTLTPYQRFAATLAGSGSLSASLTRFQRFTAALAGAGQLSTTLTPYQRIVASLSGAGSLTATLTEYQRITAALAGSGSLSVTVAEYQRIVATLAGHGALNTTITPYQHIQAALAGVGALDVDLTEFQELVAMLQGQGTLATILSLAPMPPQPSGLVGVGGSGFPADWLAKRLAQGQRLDDPLLAEIAELIALGLL